MKIKYASILFFIFITNISIAQDRYIPIIKLEKMIINDWKYFYENIENMGYEFGYSENDNYNNNVQFSYKDRESINFISLIYIIFDKDVWKNDRPNRRMSITTYDKKYINKLKKEIKSNGYQLVQPGIYQKGIYSTQSFDRIVGNNIEYTLFIDVNY